MSYDITIESQCYREGYRETMQPSRNTAFCTAQATPKETPSVALGLISMEWGKPSWLFMHLLHLEDDHSRPLSLHCCKWQKNSWCIQFLHSVLFIHIQTSSKVSTLVCRPFFHGRCFSHDAVKSDVSTKSMVGPCLPENSLFQTVQ